ncbi:MAG: 30S ribosomal protein S20 [bacterium]|nr:30S ribosomal protein S20 [bacterium]
MAKRHKSALKQLRKSLKNRERNRKIKSQLRNAVKKIDGLVAAKDIETAKSVLAKTIPMLNRAATKGIIHKNTAARLVSRLTKSVNKLAASA